MIRDADWLVLVLTLPGRKPAFRMRFWRAMKALGTAALRDGVYLLPASPERRAALESISRDVIREKGFALLLDVRLPEDKLLELFDRSSEYRRLHDRIAHAAKGLKTRAAGLKSVARLERELAGLAARDFFPGQWQAKSRNALDALRVRAERAGDLGEPHPSSGGMPRLEPARYRNRVWVTRARPWVDRLASAWLIRRFIDPGASIQWRRPPVRQTRSALGFDFDGAAFTHVDDKVTFEVLMHSFALENDPGLRRIASIVHYLDVGGVPVPEAAVLESVLRSMQERIRDDDLLLANASVLLDDLYGGHGLTQG